MATEMQTLIDIIESNAPMRLEQIIQTEIGDWKRSKDLKLMQAGQKYYIGDHDVLNRKRLGIGEGGRQVEDANLSNRKLVHLFIRKLVDQKIGYLLSKPFSIQTKNDSYGKSLEEIFGKQFLRLLKNLGKEAVNKGRGWLHPFYDENGQFAFKRIPAEEGIPLWKDVQHTELDAFIRFYDIEVYEGMNKRTITKVEFWDTSGVKRYILDDVGAPGLKPDIEAGVSGSHFAAIEGKEELPLNWERVPFVCFKYNDEEMPLIKFVQSLVDDYDLQTSDNSNNLADLPNGIYVIKNYDGTNLGEFRRNLSLYRAAKVTDEGGIDTLNLNLNPEALKQHIEQLRKDIYEFGRGVDTQSDKFGNSPSGIALRFLYSDLDMDANILETEFQASMEQLLWFVDQHLANIGAGDFTEDHVDFLFNRDILINETEAVTNAKNSVGILSDETIIGNHPWTTNTKDELKRIQDEQKADLKRMQDYPGLGGPGAGGAGGGSSGGAGGG